MSILELAAHICTPRNLETLARVKQLHAIEREMLLGRLRIDALMRLRELTDEVPAGSADEIRAAEVMRKACVDILRFGSSPAGVEGPGAGFDGRGQRSPGYHRESITPACEAEVLEALERLGEEINEYEPRAQARGSVEPLRPPPEVPPEKPTESHSSLESISRNGPGARDSGSYPPPPAPPDFRSSFDSSPRKEPGVSGGVASGSSRNNTGKMPMPPLDYAHPP
ncbi:MAG: hypothetical protein IID30_14420 [Planctomycetes bacterium]|nr:hypothetical protein [Planctomycetota bacterium]